MEYQIKSTRVFDKWLAGIKDARMQLRISTRIKRAASGNFGDHKQLAEKLFELRFTFGGGFRIYYTFNGETVLFLLAGGNKASQSKDIKKALAIIQTTGEE